MAELSELGRSKRAQTVWVLCDVEGSGEVLGVYGTRHAAADAENAYWAELEDRQESPRRALQEFVLL